MAVPPTSTQILFLSVFCPFLGDSFYLMKNHIKHLLVLKSNHKQDAFREVSMSSGPQATPLPLILSHLQTFSKMNACVCVYMYVHVTHIICICAQSLQSCPTLSDPTYCSPPGSSVHGILQARTLEWVAMPSSKGIFPTQGLNPCLLHVSCIDRWVGSLPLVPPWKSYMCGYTHISSYTIKLIPEQHEIRGTWAWSVYNLWMALHIHASSLSKVLHPLTQ